jgi:hypothetical protein
MTRIIEKILTDMDRVIKVVSAILPEGFPDEVAIPIFDGMRSARERIG